MKRRRNTPPNPAINNNEHEHNSHCKHLWPFLQEAPVSKIMLHRIKFDAYFSWQGDIRFFLGWGKLRAPRWHCQAGVSWHAECTLHWLHEVWRHHGGIIQSKVQGGERCGGEKCRIRSEEPPVPFILNIFQLKYDGYTTVPAPSLLPPSLSLSLSLSLSPPSLSLLPSISSVAECIIFERSQIHYV